MIRQIMKLMQLVLIIVEGYIAATHDIILLTISPTINEEDVSCLSIFSRTLDEPTKEHKHINSTNSKIRFQLIGKHL